MKALVAMALCGIFAFADGAPTTFSTSSADYLSAQFGFSERDLSKLRSGRAVVRTLSTSDGREIASLGAIVINAGPNAYIDRLRDIADFKKGGSVLQIGVYSSSPTVADAQGLTLPDSDIRELAKCRPGRCKVQIPGDAIERLARDAREGSAEDANRAFRRELATMVAAYLTSGPSGLPIYADTSSPTDTSDEFLRLVQSEPAILKRYGTLYRHFEAFPKQEDSIADIVYWSKEKLGPAEVVSVTHLAIQSMDEALAPVRFVAASRQLYSTHYFDASLGVTLLLAEGAVPQSTVLVYANRSRADVFGGLFGRVKRGMVASRLRGTLEESLMTARGIVERAH